MNLVNYDTFRCEFASIAKDYCKTPRLEIATNDITPLIDFIKNPYRVQFIIFSLMRKFSFSIDVDIRDIRSGLNLYNLYQEYKKVASKRKTHYIATPSIDKKNMREITKDDILNLVIDLNTTFTGVE